MGYSGRSVRDSGTEYDLNCRCLDQEVSEEKNFGMWPVNQSGDILVKNVAVPFCPSPKCRELHGATPDGDVESCMETHLMVLASTL